MHNGLSLSLPSVALRGGGAAIPGPETIAVNYGALTLAGAGGVTKPAGATAITNAGGTNLELSGGYVVPATTGVTSGTVMFDDGSEWTVTSQPDTFSVRTSSELQYFLDNRAVVDGKTVKMRGPSKGGDFSEGIITYNRDMKYVAETVYEGDDPNDLPVQVGFWYLRNSVNEDNVRNLTLRYIEFDVDATADISEPVVINIYVGAENLKFQHLHFAGNLPPWYAGHPVWDEWSAFNTLGTAGLEITDCTISGLVNFVTYLSGTNINVERNVATDMWGDFIRMGPQALGTDTANVVIADNEFYDWAGNYDTFRHADFLQGFDRGGTPAGGDVTDVEVLRNRMIFGNKYSLPAANGSYNNMQFMLMQTLAGVDDQYRRFTIRGNVTEQDSAHGITFETDISDSVIEGNTLIPSRRTYDLGASVTQPQIWLRAGSTNNLIQQNICRSVTYQNPGLSSGDTVRNNRTGLIDLSDDTELATLFQGPTFKPDTPAELISQLRMKANGPLDVDNSGAPSQGDIGALGTTTANGIANFDTRAINTGLITPLTPVGPSEFTAVNANQGYLSRGNLTNLTGTRDKMLVGFRGYQNASGHTYPALFGLKTTAASLGDDFHVGSAASTNRLFVNSPDKGYAKDLTFPITTTKTLLISMDLSADSFLAGSKAYLDGVEVDLTTLYLGGGWSAGETFDFSATLETVLFSRPGLLDRTLGAVVEFLYVDFPTVLPDISDPAVRAQFEPAPLVSSNGASPTGSAPAIFMHGDASVWNAGTNLGAGGDFTRTGALFTDVP